MEKEKMKGCSIMKKIFAMILALAMVFALCACGQSAAPATDAAAPAADAAASTDASAPAAADAIVLKIGISTNEEDPRAKGALAFADEIAEKTGGAVTAKLYPAGQLGGDADLINSIALDSGTVDIIITDASNFATYEPKMGISALPFNFADFDQAWAFMRPRLRKACLPTTCAFSLTTATASAASPTTRAPLRLPTT